MSQESGEIRESMEIVESVERDRPIAEPESVLSEIDRFEEYLIQPEDLAKEEYAIYKHILKHYSPHIMQKQLKAKIKRLKYWGELDKLKKMKNPPQREMKLKPYEKAVILYTLLVNEKHWKDLTVDMISKKVCVFLARKEPSIKKIINQMELWFEPSQFCVEIRPKVRGKVTSVPTKYIAQIRNREKRYERKIAGMQRRVYNQRKKTRQTKQKFRQAQQKLADQEDQAQILKKRLVQIELKQKDSKSKKSPKIQPDPPLEDYQASLAIINSIQDEYGVLGGLIRQQYQEDFKSSKKNQANERELRQKLQQNSKLKKQLRSADYQYKWLSRKHNEIKDELREVQGKLNKSEKALADSKLERDGMREEIQKIRGELKESEQKLANSQQQLAGMRQEINKLLGAPKGSKQARTESLQQPLDIQMLEKLTPRSVVMNRQAAKHEKDEPFSFEKKH